MTCRSIAGSVFRGQLFNTAAAPVRFDPIESAYAEIVWWTRLNDSNGDFNIDYSESQDLFRRVLLINPELDGGDGLPTGVTLNNALEWLALSDVSARIELVPGATTFNVVANSLQDLSNRANRAFRRPITTGTADEPIISPNALFAFPYPLNRTTMAAMRSSDGSGVGADFGGAYPAIVYTNNDRVLTDIAAFDVKVFSPDCALATLPGFILEPGDPGYPDGTGVVIDGDNDGIPFGADNDDADPLDTTLTAGTPQGAYVDLGHHGGGQFSQPITPASPFYFCGRRVCPTLAAQLSVFCLSSSHCGTDIWRSCLTTPRLRRPRCPITNMIETVYDTWTPAYESDGINQDPAVTTNFNTTTNTPGSCIAPYAEAVEIKRTADGTSIKARTGSTTMAPTGQTITTNEKRSRRIPMRSLA